MSIIIKLLRDKQVLTSIISILGAIVAAFAAGCKLVATDFAFELDPFGVTTNIVEEISR